MNNILSLIILLGAVQGGILSVVIYRSKFNQPANKVLSVAIFVVSIALLLTYFLLVLDYRQYPFLIKSTLPLPLIFVPLLYLYTRLCTKENKKLTLSDLKYFIPFLVVLIYNIPFYFGSPARKIAYYENENLYNASLFSDQLEIILVGIILFAFSVLIVSLVFRMRKNFENEVSNYREELIKLMFFLAWATFVFTLTGLILSLLRVAGITYPYLLDFLTAIGSTFLVYFIGYYTLLHPQIFHPLKEEPEAKVPKPLQTVNESVYDDYLSKITVRMEQDKMYRDPELTLQSFSEKINIPSYLVSKIINSKTGLNFYNFVNKYRIEEIKKELLKSPSPQIIRIAFDAGFNTKSSFYNYFKKDTGVSPKDYISQNHPEKKSI